MSRTLLLGQIPCRRIPLESVRRLCPPCAPEHTRAQRANHRPSSKLLMEKILNGAEGQNRTADTVIFSHVLYQLSYLGTVGRRQ